MKNIKIEIAKTMSIWDIIIGLIAISSLTIVIYKEFLQGYSLHASIQPIYILRANGSPNNRFFVNLIQKDASSERPSESAVRFLKKHPEIKDIEIDDPGVAKINPEILDSYAPPITHFQSIFRNYDIRIPFYIPLVIYNSGRKHAPLSKLALTIKRKDDDGRKAFYTTFFEVNPRLLLDRSKYHSDQDRISNPFLGYAIGPGENLTVNPYFVQWTTSNKEFYNDFKLLPGFYEFQVFGFDPDNKIILKTKTTDFEISFERIRAVISGAESARYPDIEPLAKRISDKYKANK